MTTTLSSSLVKRDGALLLLPLTPSAEQKSDKGANSVAVDEEKTTTTRETWKFVSVSKNGNKIRFKRTFLHDVQITKPSEEEPQRTSTEHPPPEPAPPVIAPAAEPSNQEGSLPTTFMSEHRPVPDPVIAPSSTIIIHPQLDRIQRRSTTEHKPDQPPVIAVAQPIERPRLPNMLLDDASLRSKLEASKRKLREGYQQTENVKRQRRIQVIRRPRAEIPKDTNKKPPMFKSLGTWLR